MKTRTLFATFFNALAALATAGCMASAAPQTVGQSVPQPVPQPPTAQAGEKAQDADSQGEVRVALGLRFLVPAGWRFDERNGVVVLGAADQSAAFALVPGPRARLAAMREGTKQHLSKTCKPARFGQVERRTSGDLRMSRQSVSCVQPTEVQTGFLLAVSTSAARGVEIMFLASEAASEAREAEGRAVLDSLEFVDDSVRAAGIR